MNTDSRSPDSGIPPATAIARDRPATPGGPAPEADATLLPDQADDAPEVDPAIRVADIEADASAPVVRGPRPPKRVIYRPGNFFR